MNEMLQRRSRRPAGVRRDNTGGGFIRRNWPMMLNVFLVAVLGRYFFIEAKAAWHADELFRALWAWDLKAACGRFDLVEVAFALHNIVMLTVILIRRPHRAIDRNPLRQIVAVGAFFSGTLMLKAQAGAWYSPLMFQPAQQVLTAAAAIMAIAWVLSIVCLLNLGRSFGILIAMRRVKTGGLYRVIRHPMYFTDILWRIGYLLANPLWLNGLVVAVSAACYVCRAVLEERFLSRNEEYRRYMEKVRYRFIPGIF